MDHPSQSCFKSSRWSLYQFEVIHLTQSFRQQGDKNFLDALDEIRFGFCSVETIQLMQSRVLPLAQNDILFLQSRRVDVESYNQERLALLKKKGQKGATFLAYLRGDTDTWLPPEKRRVRDRLDLAIDARVMLVVNLDISRGLANGVVGDVVGFIKDDPGYPLVKFDTINDPVPIFPFTWEIQDEDKNVLAVFRQLPLNLAWSITIHKAQGMTLKQVRVSLSHTFAYGQAYTALSRVTCSDGLFLNEPFDASAVKADPESLRFYGAQPKQSATIPSVTYASLCNNAASNVLVGKTFILTGELDLMKRDEMSNLIFRHGGHVVKTLAKSLTDAVVGKKAGPKKLKHFEENHIRQWSESDLIAAIEK